MLWRVPCVAIAVVAGILARDVAGASYSAQGADRLARLRQQEVKRRIQVAKWAQRAKPSRPDYIRKLYGPLIRCNRQDAANNAKLAERFLRCANDAENANEGKKAADFRKAAELFDEYARQNQIICQCIAKADGGALKKAFGAVARIEQDLFRLTGRKPVREWLLPDELREPENRAAPQAYSRNER